MTIGFIGGGNMARSLIGGLLADGMEPQRISVADPNRECLQALREHFSVETSESGDAIARVADVLVLAVKPQVLKQVAQALATTIQTRRPLVISIAAGVREANLRQWLGGNPAIVRAMPNTPALVQTGATALFANPHVSEYQRELAESILRAVGIALWLDDEEQMDAVTALSGSGPAYFFLVMEVLEAMGAELGLPPKTARLLTLQTALGAAKMALESEEDVAELRQRVTSPGGTTEQALKVLEQGGVRRLFQSALQAAHSRSIEIARLLGEA